MNHAHGNRHALIALSSLALALASMHAGAQDRRDVRGYWTEPAANHQVWRNGFGECWRSFNPTDVSATDGCDPLPPRVEAPAPAPVQIVQAPPPPPPLASPPPVQTTTKLSLSADALFDFDKSVLKPEGKAHLDTLVGRLQDVDLEKLSAVGHTDSKGTDAYNEKLSLRRVQAVEAYLVSKGVPATRIETAGMGERQPVAPNSINGHDNPEGRAKNRRVEVEVTGSQPRR